jgi:hypothetical protein
MYGMVRALLLALVVLLVAPDALGAPALWAETSVRVLDYTTPRWDGLVQGMVDEFNGMLPEAAPQLVYHRMPQRACQDLKPRPFTGAIVVCSMATAPFVGMTGLLHDGATTVETRVMLNDTTFLNTRDASNTVCHELMHAVTGIKDRYHRRPRTSCVWGSLPTPGRFDAAYARRVYEPHEQARISELARPGIGRDRRT